MRTEEAVARPMLVSIYGPVSPVNMPYIAVLQFVLPVFASSGVV